MKHPWPAGTLVKNHICDDDEDPHDMFVNTIGITVEYTGEIAGLFEYLVFSEGKLMPWAFIRRAKDKNILK